MSVLAIEAATSHVEVLVRDENGRTLAHEIEEVGHGHTRRITPLVARAMGCAQLAPAALRWVAVDLGPGSFTGVRVGLATAHGLALACGARVVGAGSLSALAHGTRARRALVVPMVPAGRNDTYLGFFRADARGDVRLLAAPRVLALPAALEAIEEARRVAGVAAVRCVGPGAARWREGIDARFPGATGDPHRFDGLSALDLAEAALARGGPAAGLAMPGDPPRALYVRSAQAEETVRHRVSAGLSLTLRGFRADDIPQVEAIEQRVFSDPWPGSFFIGELEQPLTWARIAERDGRLAGYALAWLGVGAGHLGNLAVVEEERRRGVAHALLEDLFAAARERGVDRIALEVRVSNFAAQALYRTHGFGLAGLRRGYYRDTAEDALIMEWRATDPGA